MPVPKHPLDADFRRGIDEHYEATLKSYEETAIRVVDVVNDLMIDMYRWMVADPWPENTAAYIKSYQALNLLSEVIRIIQGEIEDPDPCSSDKIEKRRSRP